MKVLITGGGGFIGAWVARQLLLEGVRPRVMELGEDRSLLEDVLGRGASGIDWISGDVSRCADLESALSGCDRVIHLAGALGPICQTDPARAAEINYIGTLHLLALASERAMPVVYASTALVHAEDGGETVTPGGHYGIFKLASELSAHVYAKSHGLSSMGIRPPVVYGYGRTAGNSAGLSLACRAAARGEAYTIPMSGMIEAIFVDDVASAFVRAVLEPCAGAHVANLIGDRISLDDFRDTIRTVVPEARIQCRGQMHSIASVRPGRDIRELFPGMPKTTLSDGIAATIRLHRNGVPDVTGKGAEAT
ncbi:MAG: NAD(P)-dependent oxidoreductase [Rhodospirillales bacterium]